MKNIPSKRAATAFIVVLLLPTVFWGGFKVNWSLECLAYYEQCKAQGRTGLTREQCQQRGDMVAYLLDKQICLVKNK